ncbi:MAG: hypothetical protein PQJ47_04185 [Sphaerochaetaceae bacterium]|nr:hypothetical protein [Sphaerochaetaceae bacterium]MDC7247593.1 hypothetical protein [Sphaerochaetaceae bacterium]
MFKKILLIVGQGGIVTFDSISARMGVPVRLTHMMVEELVRKGFLREKILGRYESACSPQGGHCSNCSACATPALRILELTEKGKRERGRI